jgi:hypothetical protein
MLQTLPLGSMLWFLQYLRFWLKNKEKISLTYNIDSAFWKNINIFFNLERRDRYICILHYVHILQRHNCGYKFSGSGISSSSPKYKLRTTQFCSTGSHWVILGSVNIKRKEMLKRRCSIAYFAKFVFTILTLSVRFFKKYRISTQKNPIWAKKQCQLWGEKVSHSKLRKSN